VYLYCNARCKYIMLGLYCVLVLQCTVQKHNVGFTSYGAVCCAGKNSNCQLLTVCSRDYFQELILLQLLTTFSAICGTQSVHYSVHKCLPLVPIVSQINPVHTHLFLEDHL